MAGITKNSATFSLSSGTFTFVQINVHLILHCSESERRQTAFYCILLISYSEHNFIAAPHIWLPPVLFVVVVEPLLLMFHFHFSSGL